MSECPVCNRELDGRENYCPSCQPAVIVAQAARQQLMRGITPHARIFQAMTPEAQLFFAAWAAGIKQEADVKAHHKYLAMVKQHRAEPGQRVTSKLGVDSALELIFLALDQLGYELHEVTA